MNIHNIVLYDNGCTFCLKKIFGEIYIKNDWIFDQADLTHFFCLHLIRLSLLNA